mmetsp:Transcript_34817/g.80482  ORF Transcript_34817/g.80482 Transcript_34817/m.80482 type:complete len:148 (-) Transcript_34817:128-571(-)
MGAGPTDGASSGDTPPGWCWGTPLCLPLNNCCRALVRATSIWACSPPSRTTLPCSSLLWPQRLCLVPLPTPLTPPGHHLLSDQARSVSIQSHHAWVGVIGSSILLDNALNGFEFLFVLVQSPTLVLMEESHLPVHAVQGKIRVDVLP